MFKKISGIEQIASSGQIKSPPFEHKRRDQLYCQNMSKAQVRLANCQDETLQEKLEGKATRYTIH
ncbi:hypothetical protein BOO22_14105 [Vibrio cidicii]|nr:hypothetical protein [Vibrio cidicii]